MLLQVTLEQHEFELHRSAYAQSFSIEPHTPRLVESAGVGPGIWRAGCRVVHGFSSTWRVLTPDHHIVQGSAVTWSKLRGIPCLLTSRCEQTRTEGIIF